MRTIYLKVFSACADLPLAHALICAYILIEALELVIYKLQQNLVHSARS